MVKKKKKQEPTKKASEVITEIENIRCHRLVVYVSRGSIGPWDILPLHTLLSKLGHQEHLDFAIQSPGGYADDAYHIATVLHEHCDHISILVPTRAKSAATLICLASSEILMGPTSELGPTDPMIQVDERLITPTISPLAEKAEGKEPEKTQMNAHALRDFLESVGVIKEDKTYDLDKLCIFMEKGILNPWLLGDFERSTKQVKQFAEILLKRYMFNDKPEKQALIPGIVKQLCEGYFHHNYPIGRREARDLGLEIEDMPEDLWDISYNLMVAYDSMMRKQNIRNLLETSDNYYVNPFPS